MRVSLWGRASICIALVIGNRRRCFFFFLYFGTALAASEKKAQVSELLLPLPSPQIESKSEPFPSSDDDEIARFLRSLSQASARLLHSRRWRRLRRPAIEPWLDLNLRFPLSFSFSPSAIVRLLQASG